MTLRRILTMFVLLALVLAPGSMLGGSPAMAMDHSVETMTSHDGVAASSHPCADKQAPSKQAPDNCCVMSCVAIPAVGGELAVHALAPQLRYTLPRARDPHGLSPEADPPPPRSSSRI